MSEQQNISLSPQEQLDQYLKLSEQYGITNGQLGLEYAQKALEIARANQLTDLVCFALLLMVEAKENLADSEGVETIIKEVIAIASIANLQKRLFQAYTAMASLKSSESLLDEAAISVSKAKQILPLIEGLSEKEYTDLYLRMLYQDVTVRYRSNEDVAVLSADCIMGLEQARKITDEGYQTCFLQILIMVTFKTGDYQLSLDFSKQFMEIERKRGFVRNLIGAYIFQSGILEKLGKHDEAERAFAEAEACAIQLDDINARVLVGHRKTLFLIQKNRLAEAKELCEQMMALPAAVVQPRVLYEIKAQYADIAATEGYIDDAIKIIEDELAYYRGNNDRHTEVRIATKLHKLYSDAGYFEKAYSMLLEVSKLTQEMHDLEKTKEYAALHVRFETKEKEAQLKETQLQKLNAELKAIKSQMNPHFAFNTIKTIDSMLGAGAVQEARESLRSFTHLMRVVLQQSEEEFTLIEDEVLLLDNYIKLEKNVIGETFTYNITVDPDIDGGFERVPSVFLQPLVENAIKHGLRHKEGTKNLEVAFMLDESDIVLMVSDNGIGRTASAALNSGNTKHRSFAGSALENRVKLLNEKAGYEKYVYSIEDLPQGTKATLLIKQENN